MIGTSVLKESTLRTNPLFVTGIFLYPLETTKKPLVFRYFEGVQKEASGIKLVDSIGKYTAQ